MSKEIEIKAIGGLKELYIECAKVLHSIYINGIAIDKETITEYSKDGVQELPVINWLVGKQFKIALLCCGSITTENVKERFEGLFCDKASNLYNEIRTNIECYRNDKIILQGYIKGVLSLISWEDFISKDKACLNWLCNISKQEYSDNREIFVFWGRFVECKKHLEDNIKALLEEYGLYSETVSVEPQQIVMPKELCTNEAKKYFDLAINKGLMDNKYKWLKTKALLVCFCSGLSDKLSLGKGDRIAWKPFEELFDVKNMRRTLNDIQKTGSNPIGYEVVKEILNN